MMKLCVVLLAVGCGGGKSTGPSNTATAGSGSATTPSTASDDCMGGGTLDLASADCKFWGEVMGAPQEGGTGIHMNKCCYPTLEAACTNTGGCAVADCTADANTPAQVICKDTTHGGVPTNP